MRKEPSPDETREDSGREVERAGRLRDRGGSARGCAGGRGEGEEPRGGEGGARGEGGGRGGEAREGASGARGGDFDRDRDLDPDPDRDRDRDRDLDPDLDRGLERRAVGSTEDLALGRAARGELRVRRAVRLRGVGDSGVAPLDGPEYHGRLGAGCGGGERGACEGDATRCGGCARCGEVERVARAARRGEGARSAGG